MKKLIFLLITMLCLSCTKESIEPPVMVKTNNENIKVSLDYGFKESGNIKGPSYINFYNKYINSKILTPRTYQLIFEGKDSSTFMTTAVGHWGSLNQIALPKGTYNVRGESNPTQYTIAGDTCYLSFNETVTIDANTTSLTLKANYDCSLILVDTTSVLKVELFKAATLIESTFKNTLLKTDEYYHTFARDSYLMNRSKYPIGLTMKITKRNQDQVNLLLWNYYWEAGKYYYFASTNSGYSIPVMNN